ncbi:MAG: class I SAM-dependent methyltransferase [Pasteurellaceae bacterium]|nr:class I SAM-dependent methyltransferase [Pasteurellaceae bacterium]
MTISASIQQESIKNLISTSYDEMPYTSSVFHHSQPNRLHALAKMKGLNPPAVETANILEIGCSFGGNIVPFAILNPKSQIVGVDLSTYQIQVGQQLIEQVGLDNVTLIAGDISQITFEQKFDYIICHGVYSWVPETVREAILSTVERHLSPNGVAYISYNTYPGWKEKEVIKDLMQFGCNLDDTLANQYSQAISMLNFTKHIQERSQFKYIDWLNTILENPSKHYIAHEYLEYINQPFYLKEFIGQVNRHHLAYITDSSTPAILLPLVGQSKLFEQICEYFHHHIHNIEQYLDILSNRTFRGSILVHQSALQGSGFSEHVADYNRCHDFKNLYIYALPTWHLDNDGVAGYWMLANSPNQWRFSAMPEANCVFGYLQQQLPKPVRVDDVLNYAESQPDCDKQKVIDLLLLIVHQESTYISYTDTPQPKLGRKLKLNPKFSQFIQFTQANPGRVNLSNRFYQGYALNPLEGELIDHLDGSNSITDLVNLVRSKLEEGRLTWTMNGKEMQASEIKDKQLKEAVKAALENLYYHGYFWVE